MHIVAIATMTVLSVAEPPPVSSYQEMPAGGPNGIAALAVAIASIDIAIDALMSVSRIPNPYFSTTSLPFTSTSIPSTRTFTIPISIFSHSTVTALTAWGAVSTLRIGLTSPFPFLKKTLRNVQFWYYYYSSIFILLNFICDPSDVFFDN